MHFLQPARRHLVRLNISFCSQLSKPCCPVAIVTRASSSQPPRTGIDATSKEASSTSIPPSQTSDPSTLQQPTIIPPKAKPSLTIRQKRVQRRNRRTRVLGGRDDLVENDAPRGMKVIDGKLHFARQVRRKGFAKETVWVSVQDERRSRSSSDGFGRKKVYLSNTTLTLLNTPWLPPQYATFVVPLSFTKFDIKDYLYHLYAVRVLSVRSQVRYNRVIEDHKGQMRRLHRPRPTKHMIVHMTQPFVWPPTPDAEGFKEWDREMFEAMQREQKVGQQMQGTMKGKVLKEVDELKRDAATVGRGKTIKDRVGEDLEKRRDPMAGLVAVDYMRKKLGVSRPVT